MTRGYLMALACVALAACGGGTAGGGRGAEWALDTCKTFPKEAASAASGTAFATVVPGASNDANGTALSSCSYKTADENDIMTVSLRINYDGSQTIANHVAELDSDMLGPVETLTVPTGQARWLPRMHEVIYMPDDARVITVVGPGFRPFGKSDGDDLIKQRALAVAMAAAR